MNQLDENDDGGGDVNFRIDCELSAGTRYNFGARLYNRSKTGAFTVRLEKLQGLVRAWAEESDVSIEPGQSAELQVSVQTAGETRLSYQWQMGEKISDEEDDDYPPSGLAFPGRRRRPTPRPRPGGTAAWSATTSATRRACASGPM